MAASGTKAVIKIADSAGALQDHSTYLTGGSLPRQIDALETTTFGDEDKTFIPGLKSATLSEDGNWDPTIDGWINGVAGLADRTFEYYPNGDSGTAGTNVKYSGTLMLTKYEDKEDPSKVSTFSAEWQVSGPVTRTLV